MTTLGWLIWAVVMMWLTAQGVYLPLVLVAACLVLKFVFGFISAMVRREPEPVDEIVVDEPIVGPRVIDVEVIEMRDRK